MSILDKKTGLTESFQLGSFSLSNRHVTSIMDTIFIEMKQYSKVAKKNLQTKEGVV